MRKIGLVVAKTKVNKKSSKLKKKAEEKELLFFFFFFFKELNMIETRTQGCDCSQVKSSSKSLKISHEALLGGAMVPSCPQSHRVHGSGIET